MFLIFFIPTVDKEPYLSVWKSEDKARNILALGNIITVDYPVLNVLVGNISVGGILKIFYLFHRGIGYGVEKGGDMGGRAAFVAQRRSLNLNG